jgi:Fic family protein
MLRRSNRVRTIQGSLEIEGNTLSEEQVTALIEGKRVSAPARDLREVRNAIACYDAMASWSPWSKKHFLAAHKIMMEGLVDRPGHWRTRGVGIAKGDVISHVAPPADRVPGLIGTLLDWVKQDTPVPAPIRAAVCHYELEFIHPFHDGNGRMGRLWHSLILARYHPVFVQVPVESAIRDRQADYYRVLGQCDKAGKSTAFIDFALEVTLKALLDLTKHQSPKMGARERLDAAREHFQKQIFSRKDYIGRFPSLSPATASRDLQLAVQEGLVRRKGDKALSVYQFVAGQKSN